MSNLSDLVDFFTSHGFTAAQAAGIAGNAQVESGVNPASTNPAEGALGIFQWEGGRRANLENFARQTHASATDLHTQEEFALFELAGPESAAGAALKAAKTPAQAATAWDQYYERSDGSARATRVADAQKIAANIGPGLGDIFTDPLGTVGGAIGKAADTVLGGWQSDVLSISLTVLGLGGALALFVLGARHALTDEGN